MKCRISDSELIEVFNLGELYVSDFIHTDEEPRAGKEEMKLLLSKESGLLQLEGTVDPSFMYGKYWYRSGINTSMTRELEDIATSAIQSIPTQHGDNFLDIACNDGTLLKFVPSEKFFKVGIDPCDDSFAREARKNADVVEQDFFSAESYWKVCSNKAKIVTAIAMFYDLDDPKSFLNDINEVMDDEGLLVLQLSYTPLMLKQMAFDNICHEHICFYSLTSLKYILDRCDMNIVDCVFNDVNGGSFRIYIRKKDATTELFKTAPYRDVANFRIDSILEYEKKLKLNDPETYKVFFKRITQLKNLTITFINKEKEKGKTIWGYGASTKGNTLLQWYGLDNTMIDGIAERNPDKYNHKTVGTNIPI